MDIGEAISIDIATNEHDEHAEDTCAFCQAAQEPTDEENDLVDSFDEDAYEIPGLEDDGIVHKNSAGRLGRALIAQGFDKIEKKVDFDGYSNKLLVKTAAHHIIPGNASLVNSVIMDYLHTDGMATGNIGYNINNYENGTWSCGNYALRGKSGMPKWGPLGADFLATTGKDPKVYAFKAIEKTNRQFHDAHGDYSEHVVDTLDEVAKKLEKTGDIWCPEAKKKEEKPEEMQLFALVNRLNSISRRYKKMLEIPGKNWKSNIYTSRFSKQYIDEVLKKK